MTINLIFFVITINKRHKQMKEYLHDQLVEDRYEELRNKQDENIRNIY
ncbi:uncharacterized protein (TIGR02413 family) [Bacillus ectoiniformans]|nr:YrzI family small protein [Bacillus ectoiniformans]MBM7649842.1 uncharacterized protein (TIGR02413 family) [Bacillus ectoiniformans]